MVSAQRLVAALSAAADKLELTNSHLGWMDVSKFQRGYAAMTLSDNFGLLEGRFLDEATTAASSDDGTEPTADGGLLDVLVEEYIGDLDICDINITALFNEDDEEEGGWDFLNLSPACTESETATLRDSLQTFRQCAGYELLEVNELLINAAVGAVRRCVHSYSIVDVALGTVPQGCIEAVLGSHPLGAFLRASLLRPGATSACRAALDIPACSLDLWPSPVDGKAIQLGLCLMKTVEDFWAQDCADAGLDSLDACMPEIASVFDGSEDCDAWKEACNDTDSVFVDVLLSLPDNLQGMPLPDACAATPEKASIVERYEVFRSTCTAAGKQVWEELESQTTGESPLPTIHDFIQQGYSLAGETTDGAAAPKAEVDPPPNSRGSVELEELDETILVGDGERGTVDDDKDDPAPVDVTSSGSRRSIGLCVTILYLLAVSWP